MEQEMWVIRTENGVLKWGRFRGQRAGEPLHLFWNPQSGWMYRHDEARKYRSEAAARRAVSWFHGRRWQRDMVEVVPAGC